MKALVLLAGMLLGFPAWAQAEKPEPAMQEAPKEAAKAPAKIASRKPNPKRFEDARHCLERPTNVEIIKCAEEYL
ncbi:MAG TPA: hypothetical protein VML57_05530 [Burkholderiales bacterium]|nr:hypothetical protein [Burkholderiales bacterium]